MINPTGGEFSPPFFFLDMNNTKAIAVSFLRLALGINIFLHGFIRFFSYSDFVEKTATQFTGSLLPDFLARGFIQLIPFIESIIGFFLTLGLFTLPFLIGGTFLLITLMIGMCTLQNWGAVSIQLNYILIFSICLFTLEYDLYSLDRLRKVRR